MTTTELIICQTIMRNRKLEQLSNKEVQVLEYYLLHPSEFYIAKFAKGNEVVFDQLSFEGKVKKEPTLLDWYDSLEYLERIDVDASRIHRGLKEGRLKKEVSLLEKIISCQEELINVLLDRPEVNLTGVNLEKYVRARKEIAMLREMLQELKGKSNGSEK